MAAAAVAIAMSCDRRERRRRRKRPRLVGTFLSKAKNPAHRAPGPWFFEWIPRDYCAGAVVPPPVAGGVVVPAAGGVVVPAAGGVAGVPLAAGGFVVVAGGVELLLPLSEHAPSARRAAAPMKSPSFFTSVSSPLFVCQAENPHRRHLFGPFGSRKVQCETARFVPGGAKSA
jgi:hypothetical protein